MVARFNRRFPRNPLSRREQRDVAAIDTTLDSSSRPQSKSIKTPQDASAAVADGATIASSDESHCTKETESFELMFEEEPASVEVNVTFTQTCETGVEVDEHRQASDGDGFQNVHVNFKLNIDRAECREGVEDNSAMHPHRTEESIGKREAAAFSTMVENETEGDDDIEVRLQSYRVSVWSATCPSPKMMSKTKAERSTCKAQTPVDLDEELYENEVELTTDTLSNVGGISTGSGSSNGEDSHDTRAKSSFVSDTGTKFVIETIAEATEEMKNNDWDADDNSIIEKPSEIKEDAEDNDTGTTHSNSAGDSGVKSQFSSKLEKTKETEPKVSIMKAIGREDDIERLILEETKHMIMSKIFNTARVLDPTDITREELVVSALEIGTATTDVVGESIPQNAKDEAYETARILDPTDISREELLTSVYEIRKATTGVIQESLPPNLQNDFDIAFQKKRDEANELLEFFNEFVVQTALPGFSDRFKSGPVTSTQNDNTSS